MKTNIEQDNPILDGLRRKADEDQANSEDTHALLGQTVCNPLDERHEGAHNGGDHSDH